MVLSVHVAIILEGNCADFTPGRASSAERSALSDNSAQQATHGACATNQRSAPGEEFPRCAQTLGVGIGEFVVAFRRVASPRPRLRGRVRCVTCGLELFHEPLDLMGQYIDPALALRQAALPLIAAATEIGQCPL